MLAAMSGRPKSAIGENTEDDARALAASIQAETPDAKVTVEPALGMLQGAFALFPG